MSANKPAVKIHNEADITAEEIIRESHAVYKKALALCKTMLLKYDVLTEDHKEEILESVRKEHPKFSQSYPIIMRYTCQLLTYKKTAVRKYMQYIKRNPWNNEEGYIRAQAEYPVILYKETHAHWNPKDVANLRQNTMRLLQEEHNHMKKTITEAEKNIDRKEKRLNWETRKELMYFTKNADLSCAEIVKVLIDDLNRSDDDDLAENDDAAAENDDSSVDCNEYDINASFFAHNTMTEFCENTAELEDSAKLVQSAEIQLTSDNLLD